MEYLSSASALTSPARSAVIRAQEPSRVRMLAVLMLSALVLLLLPAYAHAVISPMGGVLCGVIEFIYGNFGRALATIAVISLGVGALMGKVSWGLALVVASGIAVIFGAPVITKWLLNSAGAGGWIGCNITG